MTNNLEKTLKNAIKEELRNHDIDIESEEAKHVLSQTEILVDKYYTITECEHPSFTSLSNHSPMNEIVVEDKATRVECDECGVRKNVTVRDLSNNESSLL
jgi:hypothetical protein